MTQEKEKEIDETRQSGSGIKWVEITKDAGWANKAAGILYPKGFIVSVLPYQRDFLVKQKIGKERLDVQMPIVQKVKHTQLK